MLWNYELWHFKRNPVRFKVYVKTVFVVVPLKRVEILRKSKANLLHNFMRTFFYFDHPKFHVTVMVHIGKGELKAVPVVEIELVTINFLI